MHGPLRVLVVDDDRVSLALAVRAISGAGYDVLTAGDGAEAMRILLQSGADIVVADWVMPEMDGLALCSAIRSHEGIGFTFVVLLTSNNSRDDIIEAFAAGVDDYVVKPFDSRELLARVRAGERIVRLQQNIDGRSLEAFRLNAELKLANGQLEQANVALHRMATTDELTGLTNRREALARLAEHVAAARRHAEPFSVIMADIDHFKRFNDTYGHAVGDIVLKDTATALAETARREERVCRVGGEEFLTICPKTNAEMACVAAERHRNAVASHVHRHADLTLSVTISLGVAEWSAAMKGPDDLLKAADKALYRAKRAGRNRVCRSGGGVRPAAVGALQHAPDRSSRPESPSAELAQDRDATVLVVDDDPAIRKLCSSFLTRAGYTVEEAIDGLDALSKVDACKPDVIIMDAHMPRMDGLACTRRLKSDPVHGEIPIIMASARAEEKSVVAGLEAGVEEYIAKPIRRREFVCRVHSMVELYRGKKALLRSNAIRGEQTRVMATLLDFSRDLTATETLDAILERTVAVTSELTCCRRVSIMLPDAGSQELYIAKAIGIDPETAATVRVPFGGQTAGRVFQSGAATIVNSAGDCPVAGRAYDSDFFISAPMVSNALNASDGAVGVLNVTERQGDAPFEPHELESVDLICNVAASALQAVLTRRSRDEARDSIVVAMAKLAEYRDSDTGKHLDRVARFCIQLATELRGVDRWRITLTDQFIHDLERAVPLHDIGKVAIPDHILNKPGKLTDEEMAVIRTHAEIGAATIRSVIERVPGVPFLQMAEEIAHGHHEWFNGKGYPRGVSAHEIPPAARLAAVADVYDALTTKRVYKDAMTHEQASEIIFDSAGRQFDPDVVEAFRRCRDRFAQLAQDLADEAVVRSCPDVPAYRAMQPAALAMNP